MPRRSRSCCFLPGPKPSELNTLLGAEMPSTPLMGCHQFAILTALRGRCSCPHWTGGETGTQKRGGAPSRPLRGTADQTRPSGSSLPACARGCTPVALSLELVLSVWLGGRRESWNSQLPSESALSDHTSSLSPPGRVGQAPGNPFRPFRPHRLWLWAKLLTCPF